MPSPRSALGQHAGVPVRVLALVLLGAAVAGCGGMDAAAMVGPGASSVTADVGDLRVLRHRDDPTDGDRWIDVLAADPAVFERTASFREEGSRTAEPHEPADVRLLYEAAGTGRTIVVRMDCRGCGADGVPSTRPEDTPLLVWELVAGDGGELAVGPGGLVAGETTAVDVGDHVVVVRGDDDPTQAPDDEVLRLVGTTDVPRRDLRVDVYAAVGAGRADLAVPGGELARVDVREG